MACHNSSAYLDEAVTSVLVQTLGDLELILIDDCSTDNTLEIAKRYQVQNDRVSVLSLPVNYGPATARNAGIRAARGEWIGILDSDDVAMPSRFEEQMKLADSDKGLFIIGSSSISIDNKGHVIKEHKYPTSHQNLVKRLSSFLAFPPHSSMVYRKDIIQKVSAFNPRYVQSEDADLWFRLSEIGKVASVDKPLVKIRKHGQNISNSKGGIQQACFGFAASVCHFLRIHGCSDPSTSNEETTWQEYIKWVDTRMTEEGVFERRKAWGNARAAFFAAENRLTGAFRFACRLLQSGHASTLVWEKFFGSSLPKRLAREWMNR
jgi:glycosyltransferase involved in cell wall biosynthesis